MHLTDYPGLFHNQRILVVGDVILDHYVRGSVSRTSPEAPVPILNVDDEEWLPGGAANVAMNIVSLGAQVELMGLVGNDEGGEILKRLLDSTERMTPHLRVEDGRPTILKTRCVAQGQQMLRLDRETTHDPRPATHAAAEKAIAKLMKSCTGVILSDYGKGFLSPGFIARIVKEARARGLRVAVDPKGRDYRRYEGVTAITPNQKEASDASGVSIGDDTSTGEAAKRLQRIVRGEAIVITRGSSGVSVYPKGGTPTHIPARAREVFDVTGAGDTFIAAFGLGLFSGARFFEAAQLGNAAAGVVVGHVGVATVTPEELALALDDGDETRRSKSRSLRELEQICRSRRQNGSRIVLIEGAFPAIDRRAVRLLEQARGLGDCLIVAVPESVIEEREEMLSALAPVDFVTAFPDDAPGALLRKIVPDVLVLDGDEKGAMARAAAKLPKLRIERPAADPAATPRKARKSHG